MQSITNKNTQEKVIRFLKHFKDDRAEIVSQENINNLKHLKLLAATRSETNIPFDEYLKNGN